MAAQNGKAPDTVRTVIEGQSDALETRSPFSPTGKAKKAQPFATESWLCTDCGINTAPGFSGRAELEGAFAFEAAMAALEGRAVGGIEQTIDDQSEVYTVTEAVWAAAGMAPTGGCLCIGCLERRLGRVLTPKDFPRNDAFNAPQLPATPRLHERRRQTASRRTKEDER